MLSFVNGCADAITDIYNNKSSEGWQPQQKWMESERGFPDLLGFQFANLCTYLKNMLAFYALYFVIQTFLFG